MINFQLISPEEQVMAEPVGMAVIPGDEGEFGVLEGHSALVASISSGVLKIYNMQNSQEPHHKIFISGGFADVTPGQCTVLAEEATPVDQLDRAALTQTLSDLNDELKLASLDSDKVRLQKRIDLTNAKLDALAA